MSEVIKNSTFQDILDGIDDGIFIFNSKGKVLMVNKAAERGGSLKKNDLIGKTIDELLKGGYCDEFVSQKVLKTKEKETIIQRSEDGKEFVVTGVPLFENGKLSLIVACERDVTNLAKLQDKLSEVERVKSIYEKEVESLRMKNLDIEDAVCASENMQKVVILADKVASIESNILIAGESGVGKEVIVNHIYTRSNRRGKPFVKVNCGAIPENLLESELFGYEEGAFTGAAKGGKPGLFEVANKGILFLDEIGEMPIYLQVKLLRAIQEKKVTRVGGKKEISLDVRIIAATNRKLKDMVKKGEFRQDLYYRLSVITISIPSLRERKEDIIGLVKHFLDKYGNKYNLQRKITTKALNFLLRYDWPGNVRELENLIESLVITAEEENITLKEVYDYVHDYEEKDFLGRVSERGGSLAEQITAFEREVISEAYERYGDSGIMADELKTTRSTINRKIKKYEIK